MNFKRFLVFCTVSCSVSFLYGQQKDIDTVYVFDSQLNKVKLFHEFTTLSPQDIQKNSSNLSEVLRFQSAVYIKENGRGAVSSPSFRGTTAQQTAFVWNGININSTFLGQGDVNNIAIFGYDQMDVKAGGGSIIYGSGAIGGSIHLNNELRFNEGFNGSFHSEVASFDTYQNNLKIAYSKDKFSFKASGNYFNSENDYEVPEEQYINRNGKYYNSTANIGFSYKVAPHQKISWQSQFYDALQNYPIFTENGNRTKYAAQTTRSLLVYDITKSKLSNSLKAAYTEENFQYFGVYNAPKTSGGTGKNYIFKDDFNYFILPKLNFNFIGEFQINKGEGYDSGISNVSRNIASTSGLLRYFVNENLRLEAGIKKDFVEDIESPILYSFSGKWNVVKWYSLGVNFSKNFRYPSFNDLYWKPGGNLDLKAETSIQTDMSNEFLAGKFKLNLTPYYMKIKDMIQWIPGSEGYWTPRNVRNVESYGLESKISFEQHFSEDHALKINTGYSYTKSIDLETQKQLMYVPFHKVFGNADYQYKFLKLYVQGMFNGKTFTTSDENNAYKIDPYFVLNAGLSSTILKKYTLGFRVNNITDEVYETMAYYPLPKRNYSIYATIKF